ncbi:ABC transporter ATP-binding protein [Clostridium ganghwense]|uniref:ABC transporter ATP-binding protein n=1 Tax=Clostridium ganghwense TaxID=312089 RepID=A0ABT4CL66_9CLOT|nr:ABC transporter ATP-binding protein [Clostridium ganghwense]MCY6369782.1 ABC transporter ATP-binding protein [Clostridium ganghwense]
MDILNVNGISFYYGETQILKNISFSVGEGKICCILGQNGTGKTTLLKCIQGILQPKKGEVLIKGKSVYEMKCKQVARNISVVPQQMSVVFPYTVLDIVLMAKVSRTNFLGAPKKKDENDVIKILNSLKISHLCHKRFNELSGGERQMVLMARAIYQDTPIVLLDEPTSHLDYKNQIVIMEMIKHVVKTKKITAIINIHDPNLALNYCDDIIMIKNGCLLMKGNPEDIICERYLSNLYDMSITVDKTRAGKTVVVPWSA